MEENGYEVEIRDVSVEQLDQIRRRNGVPAEMESCHYAEINGYFVEGHVPVEAIEKMLVERPDIDGIAVPEMPPGAPGMGGTLTEPITVFAILDGTASEFIIVDSVAD